MATQNDDINYRDALESSLVRQTLASWRFLLFFSLPPLVWMLVALPHRLAAIFIIILCAQVWLSCWRLWLDEHYFRFITPQNNTLAGEILHVIWQREKLQRLTLADRQQGALRLLRRTLWSVAILWGGWIISVVWGV